MNDLLLQTFLNYQLLLVLIALVLSLKFKLESGSWFSVVTLSSFLISFIVTPFLYEYDTAKFYRYFFWAFNDIVWMSAIAILGIKDRISLRLSVTAQLIFIPVILIQLFKIVDKHFLDYELIDSIYKTIIPLSNTLVVLLCFAPLAFRFFIAKQKQLAN